MSEHCFFPASVTAVAVLGPSSFHLSAGASVPSPGKWASCDVLSLEHSPESPIQREIVLLPGSGSSFPATNRAFTMGMHLFIGVGFIFMEKLLWAGVVPGESAGLLSCARSCHCGCSHPGTRATKPWAGICGQSSAGFLCPSGFLCPVGSCILSGVFILPLQKASSFENVAQHEAESSVFLAEMCTSAGAGEGRGNGFILTEES